MTEGRGERGLYEFFEYGYNDPVFFARAASEIVIRQSGGIKKTVAVHPKVMKNLRQGSAVKATLKNDGHTAESIEVEMS